MKYLVLEFWILKFCNSEILLLYVFHKLTSVIFRLTSEILWLSIFHKSTSIIFRFEFCFHDWWGVVMLHRWPSHSFKLFTLSYYRCILIFLISSVHFDSCIRSECRTFYFIKLEFESFGHQSSDIHRVQCIFNLFSFPYLATVFM